MNNLCGECRFAATLYLERTVETTETTSLTYYDMEGVKHIKKIIDKPLGEVEVTKHNPIAFYRCCPGLSNRHVKIVHEEVPCVNKNKFQPREVEPKN